MTVVFDAEALLAFSFDEPGAGEVELWLDRVYDGHLDGYISTINLAEFRYIAVRNASVTQADAHIDVLRNLDLTEYTIDPLWEDASELRAEYSLSIGDAYAVATAKALDTDGDENVTLLVDADDDYDVLEDGAAVSHLIERFRDEPA